MAPKKSQTKKTTGKASKKEARPQDEEAPETQPGGQPADQAEGKGPPQNGVRNPEGVAEQSPERDNSVDHALQGLRAAAAGPSLKLARDPVTENKVRAILMGGASSAVMFALLTKSTADDRIAGFILQKVQDPNSWSEIANAIWGEAETRFGAEDPGPKDGE